MKHNQFGVNIRISRKIKGWDIHKLSKLSKVAVGQLSKIENGGNTTLRSAEKICRALGVRLSEMVGEKDRTEECIRALKCTVISTIGGTVDCNPTGEHNFLGRLRELVECEKAFQDSAQLLRSALSIAQRRGKETNWEAFTESVKKQCDTNHSIQYPKKGASK